MSLKSVYKVSSYFAHRHRIGGGKKKKKHASFVSSSHQWRKPWFMINACAHFTRWTTEWGTLRATVNATIQENKAYISLLERDTSGAAANKDNPIIGGQEFNSLLRLAIWDTVSENSSEVFGSWRCCRISKNRSNYGGRKMMFHMFWEQV